jgi:hypothetical protein
MTRWKYRLVIERSACPIMSHGLEVGAWKKQVEAVGVPSSWQNAKLEETSVIFFLRRIHP